MIRVSVIPSVQEERHTGLMTLFKSSWVLLTAVLLCYNELTTWEEQRSFMCVNSVKLQVGYEPWPEHQVTEPWAQLVLMFWWFVFLSSMSYRNSYKWRTLHLSEMIMNNQAVRAVSCFYKDNAILIVSPSICCSFSQRCSWMGIKTVINAQKAFPWKRTHLGCL